MRKLIAASAIALAGATATGALVATQMFQPPPAEASMTCNASTGPQTTSGGGNGDGQATQLNDEQRHIVSEIIRIGSERQLSPRAWQIAIQAGMTESKLTNLDYGDRDSLGIFQMRPSMGWGTPQQLQDIEYQVNKFYDVLLEVPGWKEMRPGEAAQAVERSAFPDRYHEWEPMAVTLISQQGDIPDPTGCGSGDHVVGGSETAQTVIEAARKQLGQPYAWGGGTAAGPSRGIRDGGVADAHGDYNKTGFDCSGLTLYAYAQAGITLPRVSAEQYHAGKHVPIKQAQPGDLVFWSSTGDPAGIHHVAIYLGNGKILEAPQSGSVVKESALSERGSGLLPHATRPGVQA